MHPDHPCRISTIILTLDEEENLSHCLGSLDWCDDIIVVDSGSTDSTESIAKSAGARFFNHPFCGHGSQRNWAMESTDPKHDWILILDADECVPLELAREMNILVADCDEGVAAARVRRRFHMWGKWLRYSSLYPTWVVRLVHRERVRYIDRGHAETQSVDGSIVPLEHDLIDENHKGEHAWYDRQKKYAEEDARYELEQSGNSGSLGDLLSGDPLIRKMAIKRLSWQLPFRPLCYFAYSYILRGGFLDGKAGFRFCLMRSEYQKMVVASRRELQTHKAE